MTIKFQTSQAQRLLQVLNHLAENGKHIYAGTANPKKVAKRRAKNRVAKQSRRANRG